jgi:dTMP kinase
MSGKFITFEGGEGAGKSTQIGRLAEWLRGRGKEVILTREPGGTPNAEEIRALVVKGNTDKWFPVSELLLYMAARYDHIERVIKPALKVGKYVLCDRFIDSTVAYQGWGHGLDMNLINQLIDLVSKAAQPDITFLLDLKAEEGMKRAIGRHGLEDRYEKLGLDFHERVREGFLAIASMYPKRCVVLDASLPIEEVTKRMCAVMGQRGI